MVKIPAGTFLMGSPVEEYGRLNDELQHKVTLTKDFWIGKYEVTQSQWRALTNENPAAIIDAAHPVEQVSWHDAKEFCDKLNEKFQKELPTGYKFNLPTEAQWEYACRAGTNTALNNGLNLSSYRHACPHMDKVGWYKGNFGGVRSHKKVGKKQPNAWGLYDMHGNVSEWCLDTFDDYTEDDAIDPVAKSFSLRRALRGGCWSFAARHCRSASRQKGMASRRFSHVGFRLVLSYSVDKNSEKK
jgi:formylglycine-generating enzyme required for sulfatase activity